MAIIEGDDDDDDHDDDGCYDDLRDTIQISHLPPLNDIVWVATPNASI